MSEYTATQIPKPSDEQAFERCNRILWRCILRDETVKLYGRRGQNQYGVDLIGIRENTPDRIVGVQCKLKGYGKNLTEVEVRSEVEKALAFRPLLSEYIIVTTAPDDANLDTLALELSISASKDREKNLKVRVLGWGSLELEIRRYPQALHAFDPSHTPYGHWFEKNLEDLPSTVANVVALRLEMMLQAEKSKSAISPTISDTKAHTTLDRQINDYAVLVSTNPAVALGLFQKLQADLDNNATDLIQFRIAANIAACQFNLGEEETAAQGFIAAYDFDPSNSKAITHKALGLFIKDDWIALKAFAETQLSEFPNNAKLAAIYIQGMVADETVSDPLAHVPESVRGEPEVAEAHVRWLMVRGSHGAWWDAAIAAHNTHSDNDALSEIFASALLERVLDRADALYDRPLSKDERTDVETAISIYETCWPHVRDHARHGGDKLLSIPLNLMVAYRLQHQGEKAIAIGNEALDRFPESITVKEYVAFALLEQGDVDRALSVVSELEPSPNTVMIRYNVAMATRDWDTVSGLIDAHEEIFPEEVRGLARAARVLANVEQAPVERRCSIIEAEQDTFKGDIRALILLAQGARKHGFTDLARTYFTTAQSAFERGDDGFASRLSIAQEAMESGKPGIAADILTGHMPLDNDSAALRLLAQALAHDFPIRDRAVRFFEGLSPEVRSLPVFQSFEGILHLKRGAPEEAVDPFANAFEKQPCIENLMGLIAAYSGVGDRDSIVSLLQRDGVDTLRGSTLARIDFCHVLLDYEESARALELGYEALIDGLDRAEVVRKFLGLVIKPTPNRPDKFDGMVSPGVWVRLTSSRGEDYEVLVGESADRPWGESIDPSNTFVAKALGLTIGDTFEHADTLDVTETWTVSVVKPRWLQAFHHLSRNFGRRFPDARGYASVPIAEGEIEPVLEQVRRLSEAARSQANLYLIDKIPIAFLAGDRLGGSVGFVQYLISIGEGVRVCFGTEDERTDALALIEDNGCSGAVLDGFTAWRAAELGVFPVLKEQLGPLVIPANEFRRLQQMLDDPVGEANEESMSLTYQDGQYIRQIMTPEERAGQLDLIESRLAAIQEACTVEPVVIPDDLSEVGETLLGFPSGDAIAPAVIAGQDRLLLCEDMMMRQWAGLAFGTKGVWLQAVLLSAQQAETMTLSDYSEALVHFAAYRDDYISISTPVLLSAFERDTSNELVHLQALCAYIGTKTAEPVSHIRLAADFINAIWVNKRLNDLKVQTATNIVMGALLARKRGEEWANWAASLILKLSEAPRIYFTTSWCQESLLRLLLYVSNQNSIELDGLRRVILPVISGGRNAIELQDDWTIALDMTSIIVLDRLDLLKTVVGAFHHTKLAPDIMEFLLRERNEIRFHQPSRLASAKGVRELHSRGQLRAADELAAPPKAIIDQVGLELAGLFQMARHDDGKVICVLPIHKVGSLMKQQADTSEYDDLILSTMDLCKLCHDEGKIDATIYQRARSFLHSQGQSQHASPLPSVFNGPIYIDRLALSYLQSANLLQSLADSGVDIRIHPNILGETHTLSEAGDVDGDSVTKIERIRDVLGNALVSGTASFLSRAAKRDNRVRNHEIRFQATASLLAGNTDCNALCIDDRYINSHPIITNSTGQAVPIVSVLDVLRYLVTRGCISVADHWIARHKLRQSGFVFVPIESDELVHWLESATVDDGKLKESTELRILRQAVTHIDTLSLAPNKETVALSANIHCAIGTAIERLWQDSSLTIERTMALSDWVWRYLMMKAILGLEHFEQGDYTAWLRRVIPLRLGNLLLPTANLPQDRRVHYTHWIERSVLEPLRPANMNIIEKALTSAREAISRLEKEQDAYGHLFLDQLPEAPRRVVIAQDAEFAKRSGFETRQILAIGSDVKLVNSELFAAAREVLATKKARPVQDIAGKELLVGLDMKDQNIVVKWSDAESVPHRAKFPELALLLPKRKPRIAALRSLIEKFGPTAPDFQGLLTNMDTREAHDQELSTIFNESTNGVASLQASFIQKINSGGGFNVVDIIPQSFSYYEQYAGPAPGLREPEPYFHKVLVPYRKALLNRDVRVGLDICCLGALRDDLTPGLWCTTINDDLVWDIVSSCDVESNPFSLLGALDIALYRQGDHRFRDFSAEAVATLLDEQLGQQDGPDLYRLLHVLADFVLNRINLLENGSNYPGYWKRMCAWMQAGLIARALTRLRPSIDVDALQEWTGGNMELAGVYSNLVSARKEPMLFAHRISSPQALRNEILGRLYILKSRHESAGHQVPRSEDIDHALAQDEDHGQTGYSVIFPGPLEGHRRPMESVPQDVIEKLGDLWTDSGGPFHLRLLVIASQSFALGKLEMKRALQTVRKIAESNSDAEPHEIWEPLGLASIVAAANRSTILADGISDAVVRVAPRISEEKAIQIILQIMFQAAAAHETHDAWFKWLEEKLTSIAIHLPARPNKFLRMFLDHLDEVERVLPIESWFHARARLIASSRAT